MKKTRKQQIVETVASIGGAAAGGLAGVAGATAFSADARVSDDDDNWVDDDDIEIVSVDPPVPQSQANSVASHSEPQHSQQPGQQQTNMAQTDETVIPDDVKVHHYTRMTDEDGNPYDLAVIEVDGTEVAVIDADLDGVADAMLIDYNGDGKIDTSEIIDVQAQNIAMQPLADANEGLLFDAASPDGCDAAAPDEAAYI